MRWKLVICSKNVCKLVKDINWRKLWRSKDKDKFTSLIDKSNTFANKYQTITTIILQLPTTLNNKSYKILGKYNM